MLDISWIVSGRMEELVAEANDVDDIHAPKCLLLLQKFYFQLMFLVFFFGFIFFPIFFFYLFFFFVCLQFILNHPLLRCIVTNMCCLLGIISFRLYQPSDGGGGGGGPVDIFTSSGIDAMPALHRPNSRTSSTEVTDSTAAVGKNHKPILSQV